MKPHFNNTNVLSVNRRTSFALQIICLALFGLSGCADKTLQHTFYDGVRSTAGQCQLARKPSDTPCAALPEYSQYEKERAREKGIAESE